MNSRYEVKTLLPEGAAQQIWYFIEKCQWQYFHWSFGNKRSQIQLEWEEESSTKERIQWESNIKYEKNDIDIVKDIQKRQTNINLA